MRAILLLFQDSNILIFYTVIIFILLFFHFLIAGVPTGPEGQIIGDEGKVLDEILGELYVFLVRESNLVLNAVYTETVIDR